MNFSIEQINKARQAKSAEELLALAKENGVEMTEEQAKSYLAELHKEGELTDEELSAVVGGEDGCKNGGAANWFSAGDIVKDAAGVQYEIQGLNDIEYDALGIARKIWFTAIVKYVPESAKPYTCLSVGDTHYVHSAIVKKVS